MTSLDLTWGILDSIASRGEPAGAKKELFLYMEVTRISDLTKGKGLLDNFENTFLECEDIPQSLLVS